tara:strand:+ start:880 stop:1302 length:423 start_codon:yes stop_codon:yes gene_type:complete
MIYNIKNKILIFLIIFFSVIILSFTNVKSKGSVKEIIWHKGSKVYSLVVCEKEKDILEIAYADSRTIFSFRETLQVKLIQDKCAVFNPPLELKVQEILGDYIDYNKIRSTILAVSALDEDKILGYLIVAGRPATDKETTF